MADVEFLDQQSRERYLELQERIGLVSFSSGRRPIQDRLGAECTFEVNGGIEIPVSEAPDTPVPVIKWHGAGDHYDIADNSPLYALQWSEYGGSRGDFTRTLVFRRYPHQESLLNALALIRLLNGFTSGGFDQAFECKTCGNTVHWSTVTPSQKRLEIVGIHDAVLERRCDLCDQTGRQPGYPESTDIPYEELSQT